VAHLHPLIRFLGNRNEFTIIWRGPHPISSAFLWKKVDLRREIALNIKLGLFPGISIKVNQWYYNSEKFIFCGNEESLEDANPFRTFSQICST